MSQSDEALVCRAQRDDRRAFEELVDRYKGMALNTAHRILRNREDAEDAAQESFIRVFRSLSSFRGEAKFSTWLYQIVTHVCLNQYGYSHAQQTFISLSSPYYEEMETSHPELADRAHNPAEWVADEDFKNRVWTSIADLPPPYRAVLTLYYLQELSYEEIAQILSLPMGTVKTHLHRAKAMLKRRLLERYTLEELSP